MKKNIVINNKFIIYQTNNGNYKISVHIEDETVWLSQKQIAELFWVNRSVITKHLKKIFESWELEEKSNVQKMHFSHSDKPIKFYNLETILSVWYRVNSNQAKQFRIWTSKILKEYITKGFTIDDEKLKGNAGGNYWKELLDRIRDIRSSEKVLYRQVLDLYATSVDYDAKNPETIRFFKTVQNKLHYATHKNTSAEIIYNRADAEKEFMGLTTFIWEIPVKSEVIIAKNYLTEKELFRLNRLVSAFFDLAEIKAEEEEKMYMKDWVLELNKFSKLYGKGILLNSGKISKEDAIQKAEKEYKKYQVKTLSSVEKAYLENLKDIVKQISKKD